MKKKEGRSREAASRMSNGNCVKLELLGAGSGGGSGGLRLAGVLLLAAAVFQLAERANSSGVFEISFSSLVDAYERDLRDECCSWQNHSNNHQLHNLNLNLNLNLNHNNQHHHHLHHNQHCDPTKCQLIIRICVKNYQTQIDPSQCTFGELSAQVMRPNEPAQFAHYPQYAARGLQAQAAQAALSPSGKRLSQLAQGSQATNIHHQRMLLQQQAPILQHQPTQTGQHSASGQVSPMQPKFYHQPILSSGQPRAMRTISFYQPISFPFNFTWPVSRCCCCRCCCGSGRPSGPLLAATDSRAWHASSQPPGRQACKRMLTLICPLEPSCSAKVQHSREADKNSINLTIQFPPNPILNSRAHSRSSSTPGTSRPPASSRFRSHLRPSRTSKQAKGINRPPQPMTSTRNSSSSSIQCTAGSRLKMNGQMMCTKQIQPL